ncbi:MAG: penicillin acylase family protein [Candidatus Limnocylindrales bacterium]
MRALKIAVVGLLVVVLVVVVGGIGALAWVTGRAQPQVSGTVRVPGLAGEATVARDIAGIAHITAQTPADLFFAQGYVHASERMWQMEVWRHISAGRLSELFGESQLDTDRFIRTLGWRAAAERDLASVSAAGRVALDGYAAGVNAWLDTHRDSLGLAFIATGTTPEPWTVLDTLAWGKVQAWNLGGNVDAEIFRYLADARLGDPARTDELFAPREGGPVITPTGLPGSGGSGADGAQPPAEAASATAAPRVATIGDEEAVAWRAVAAAAADALAMAGLDAGGALASDDGLGSNDWVVGPSMSATGGALLANDPHLGIALPSIWFINGLHCVVVSPECPYDVAGVSFPGVPGVVLGHNARVAWGVTNVDPDVQDLVIETPDPADPTRYLGPDGTSLAFTVRTEQIAVKGADTVALEVRETVHGPLLNGVDERLAGAPLMALRWTGTLPSAAPDRTFDAVLALNVAADFDDFRAALSVYGAPSQNFVYADVDGHIGYQLPGTIPVRSDPDDRGLRPVRGDDGTGEWVDFIPFDDLPRQFDPIDGWIVTANNAAVDDEWPDFIGGEWDPGYRAERIIDLINDYGQDGLTVPEMGAIQNDTSPLRARDIALLLGDGEPATEDGQIIAARIADWDGTCTIDSQGCAAYMTWEYRVLRAVFDDELGDLARDYVGSPYSWVTLERLVTETASTWWDDTRTPEVETADVIVLRAMDEAGAELRTALSNPERWVWGELHQATFAEGTVGQSGIGPLEWYFNHDPVAVPGTAGAVNNAYYRLSRAYPDPLDPEFVPVDITRLFSVTNLPSYRLLIDMTDLDGARVVITTGQAGNPFDRHYTDQIDPWRSGETLPFPFTPEAVTAATVTTLTLTP